MTPEEWAIHTRNNMVILSDLPDRCKAIENLTGLFHSAIREAEERVRRETIEACARIAEEYDAGHEFDQYEIAAAIRSCPDSTAGTS